MEKSTKRINNNKDNIIKVKYLHNDDYNPVYVNGVYGGITAQDEIVANFFLERHPIPNDVGISISEQKEIQSDRDYAAVRFITNGIILNLDAAKCIKQWLEEKINLLEDSLSENKTDKKDAIGDKA